MRIVTRPDFDGIVCAMIIHGAESVDSPIEWIEPSQVQNREVEIRSGDIMANLPYDPRCSLWFDHHVSNAMEENVNGSFKIAPSAAGVVYEYYRAKGKIKADYDELILWTDIIDAAKLSKDQVLYPENYSYILLSMTVQHGDEPDALYWNRLVFLLRDKSIKEVLDDPEVIKRCRGVIKENAAYGDILKQHTAVHGSVSVTDFRSMESPPSGNRFLIYSLFPDSVSSMKIRYADSSRETVVVSLGHSILNRGCRVNVGRLLAGYGGGGHAGAGGCSIEAASADMVISELLEVMKSNCDN